MFQGSAALNLDAKGRLGIPARHRDALASLCDGHLVITAHPHRCLLMYPAPAWEPIRASILSISSLDKRSASLKRLLVGHARDEELDGAGRVLIAPELREWARAEKEVVLLGQGSHFELWSAEGWKEQQASFEELDDSTIPDQLAHLVL